MTVPDNHAPHDPYEGDAMAWWFWCDQLAKLYGPFANEQMSITHVNAHVLMRPECKRSP